MGLTGNSRGSDGCAPLHGPGPGTTGERAGGPQTPVVQVEGVSVSFGRKPVLHGVSARIRKGAHVAIIGPNGAGKSTLLKAIDGLLPLAAGQVSLQGRPLASWSRKEIARLVSYVPQADGRTLPFPARDFVMMGRYPHLSPLSAVSSLDREAVNEAMRVTGTERFAERRVDTLSGGERQKLFIAAAIAQGAEVLLLDEPTTFLDPKHQADVLGLLARLNKERGVTLLTVTHDINSAALWADEILALREGRIAWSGPAEDAMDNRVLGAVFDHEFRFATREDGKRFVLPEGGGRA